jgi:hypothetical protein
MTGTKQMQAQVLLMREKLKKKHKPDSQQKNWVRIRTDACERTAK